MNKCEHNLPIDKFCISEHCTHKEPGGCEECFKKYHSHQAQLKFVTETELSECLKIFSLLEAAPKPNCRNIQEALYTYFSKVKYELTQVIDLLCKTVINYIGAPYLMENQLFNSYKKLKNKEYRRLHQKDIHNIYELAKNTSSAAIIKEEAKLYQEQLKKFSKMVESFETTILSYENLLNQVRLTYKHEQSHFQLLELLIKQTLNINDTKMERTQFDKKETEKSINFKDENNKGNETAKSRKFKSQSTERQPHLKNSDEFFKTTLNSGNLSNKEKEEKKTEIKQNPINNQPKIESSIPQDFSALHKFGVSDFSELEKKENIKETINAINLKRPSSLERNLKTNNNNLVPEISVGKNEFFKFDETDEYFSPQIEKNKIQMKDKRISIKNNVGIAEIFGNENASTFFTTNSDLKRAESLMQVERERELEKKEAEMNLRKQKLIEMMRKSEFSKKTSEPLQVDSLYSSPYKKSYSKDTMSKEIIKKESVNFNKNNSVIINPSSNTDRFEIFEKEKKFKKNASSMIDDKDFYKSKINSERKYSYSHEKGPKNINLNNIQIEKIKPINECISETFSVGSLEAIKHHLLPEKNMNGLSKLPIEEEKKKEKVIGCSRLIIVPTTEKIPHDEGSESPLIKKKTVLLKSSPQKEDKNSEKSQKKLEKKQSLTSEENEQEKHEMTDSEQKSLALLIKSINQKPEQAIESLEAALKESANNLSAAEYLSYLYLEAQKPKETLIVCNKILERFEVESKENEELLINLENNKAAALNMLGRYSEAIVILQKCLKVKETDCLLKNLGDAYYFSSSYEKAISCYEKTVKMSPNYDEAYHNMAVCFYLMENYQRAKNTLEKAIDISPKNSEYLEFMRHIEESLNEKSR